MKLKIGNFLTVFMSFFAFAATGADEVAVIRWADRTKFDTPCATLQEAIDNVGSNDVIILKKDIGDLANKSFLVTNTVNLHSEGVLLGTLSNSVVFSIVETNAASGRMTKGLLRLWNDGGDTNTSFCGTFDLKGGSLDLTGLTCYSDSSNAVIITDSPRGETNSVFVRKTTFIGESPTMICLNGAGKAVFCDETSILPSRAGHLADTAVQLTRGDLVLDTVMIEAGERALLLAQQGESGYLAPTGAVTCVMSNATLKSSYDGVLAVAGQVDLSVVDSTVAARYSGIRLARDWQGGVMSQPTLTVGGSTKIETETAGIGYAIEDGAEATWNVNLVSGVFSRMDVDAKESINDNWVSLSSEPIWEGERLTVTYVGVEKVKKTVIYDCNGGQYLGQDVYTNTQVVAKEQKISLGAVVPTNADESVVFVGWATNDVVKGTVICTEEELEKWKTNLQQQVAGALTNAVYAGWMSAAATFHSCTNVEGWVTPVVAGLAWAVEGETIDLSKVSPVDFGWSDANLAFDGWRDATNGATKMTLSLPVTSNDHVYASWIVKTRPGDVCRIVGEEPPQTYASIAEAMSKADGRMIALIDNVEKNISVTNGTLNLRTDGFSIGTAPLPIVISVKGGTLCLQNDSTVYGRIYIGDGATVRLTGGTFTNAETVVAAVGKSYEFVAEGARFTGGSGEDIGFIQLIGQGTNCIAVVSNSTVICDKDVTGVYMNGCVAEFSHTEVVTSDYGFFLDADATSGVASNACAIVNGSTITAGRGGIYAHPAEIFVADSTIVAKEYAFQLNYTNGLDDIMRLTLSGENVVSGGTVNVEAKIDGGLFLADSQWKQADVIEIAGGTYAHIASNSTTVAQVQKWAEGCVVTWLSDTCFSVFDPLSVAYRISYVTNGIPSGAVLGTNENPVVYTAASNFTFTAMTCVSVTNASLVATADWYLVDPPTVYSNLAASAIYDGQLYLYDVQGKTNVFSGVSCTNITLKTGEWTWREPPTPPSGDITIYFKTGVADPEDPESHDSEVDWNYESEEHAGPWPKIDEEYASGVDFPTNLATHTLPTATWKGHKFNGWQAYVIEEDEENVKTNYMGTVFVDTISLEDLRKVEEEYDGNLHAVWDRGGSGGGGISSFDELFNMDDLPPLTGGDTYVGYIHDGGVSVGTITIKCGVPQADGRVPITAIVQEIGKPTRTFKGWGTYNGDTITVDELVNGEDSLSMDINSKMATGSYNGYSFEAGVNGFKGSEEAKDAAEQALEPWLGKWMLVFATTESGTSYDGEAETDVDGQAFAWGYSHVLVDIREKGKVVMSGKLASGKEVSATATAIVGDNGVCIPAVCSIYSGYDWWRCGGDAFGDYLMLDALGSDLAKMYMKKTNRGGFGFTAWFSRTNDTDYVNVNNVSEWDSTKDKSMPFIATVAYTNHQRVAAIELPATGSKDLEFCVDMSRPGWLSNTDRLGDIGPGEDYIPANPSNTVGYVQFVNVTGSTSSNGTATVEKYAMKAANKAPKMKLVDGSYIVPNKGGSNYANLKLKYKSDKGLFSGSFKVYSVVTDDETGDTKLKKTKVAVSGGIAEGRGYGVGYADKVGSQPVLLVKPSEADKLLNDESEAKPAAEDDEDDSADKEEGPSES